MAKGKHVKRVEWSKFFSTIIALSFGIYGIWCGTQYYKLCEIAIATESSMPDPALAVTCITVVIGSLISYLLYQAGLKTSRNKYGVDCDGQPYREQIGSYEDTPDN